MIIHIKVRSRNHEIGHDRFDRIIQTQIQRA